MCIRDSAKTVSLFLMHPFFLTGFYQLSVAQFPAGDFRVPCRTLNRFLFFFTCSVVVFRVIVREYLLNHPLLLLLCLVRQTEDATKRVACTKCCGVGQAQQYYNSSCGSQPPHACVYIRTAVESSTTQSASRHQKTICLSAVLLAVLSPADAAVVLLYSST